LFEIHEKEGVERETLSETAFATLRGEIVNGALKPNQKLNLRILKERYGLGASPLREALMRLHSEGLVVGEGQRGFWVAPTTRDDLIDVIESRRIIEGAALKLAMERGDEQWEAQIVILFRRMERFDDRIRHENTWLDDWEKIHGRLHVALIAGCGSPRMLDMCERLYIATERYRRLYNQFDFVAANLIESHRELVEVVLDRDISRAVDVHAAHLSLTLELAETLGVGNG
jgi:DNA-binding GntR family transcriptional regulator